MQALWLLLAAAVIAGCGGRAGEPPRPDRSIAPDRVSLADHWDFGPCNHISVTLRSGEVLDVARSGNSGDPACPDQTPTTFLLGSDGDLTYRADANKPWINDDAARWGDNTPAPLVLMGTHDGQPWLGAVTTLYGGCWQFRFERGAGAYLEGAALHLTSGLVLPLAEDFASPEYPRDAFPLRQDDAVCLNSEGEVLSVEIWIPY